MCFLIRVWPGINGSSHIKAAKARIIIVSYVPGDLNVDIIIYKFINFPDM